MTGDLPSATVAAIESGAPSLAGAGAFGKGPPIDARAILYGEPGDDAISLPVIEKAVARMQESNVLSAPDFYAIRAAARRQAFTVSGDLTEKTIDKLREMIAHDLARGTSRTEFMAAVEAAIPTLPISESHLEQVYRNAVNESFSQGQEHVLSHPLVDDEFPYRVYVPIRDDRARHEHLALEFLGLNGTAYYHKSDGIWQLFRPPWDWNCRCGWYPATVEMAAAAGVVEAQEWLRTGVEPPHTPLPLPNFRPDPRWDRSL